MWILEMISAQETVQSRLIRTEVHSYRLGDGNFCLHEASENTVFNTVNFSVTDVCHLIR
jgi:hypothetical protein